MYKYCESRKRKSKKLGEGFYRMSILKVNRNSPGKGRRGMTLQGWKEQNAKWQ